MTLYHHTDIVPLTINVVRTRLSADTNSVDIVPGKGVTFKDPLKLNATVIFINSRIVDGTSRERKDTHTCVSPSSSVQT